MVLHYSDQMTAASVNLINLQCFTGRYLKGVKIVEPFLHPIGSTLGVCLSPSFDNIDPQSANTVKFSDVFDIDEWTNDYESRNYAPLITWDEFINSSPTKIILIHHHWYTKDCDQSLMTNATREFIAKNKFEIVRQVCINFRSTGVISIRKFLETIYGPFKPDEVVVIFNIWGGIVSIIEDFRYSIKDAAPCYRGHEERLFYPSKQLLGDVKNYSMRHMNKTKHYLVVMVRIEWYARKHKFNKLPAEVQRNSLIDCFHSIRQRIVSVKQERHINYMLLAMDVGKHGTIYFRRVASPILDIAVLNETVPKLLEILFGKPFTQEKWEESFESVARFKVPGYVAMMQKELAANSTCLILMGGGSYQRSVEALYNKLHEERCLLHTCT